MTTPSVRWTSADLERLPDDGNRYEIIDGELLVSKQPNWHHQVTCTRIATALDTWSRQTRLGVTTQAPGVIFADDDDVVPDVVWISGDRLAAILDRQGHLQGAPELVVEVLSPGSLNERRDREAKLRLYSRRDVDEYWIVDWRARTVEIYRRFGPALALVETIGADGSLTSPLLPNFSALLAEIFADFPSAD